MFCLPAAYIYQKEERAYSLKIRRNKCSVFLIMKVPTVTTYPSSSSTPRVVEIQADTYTVLPLQTACQILD